MSQTIFPVTPRYSRRTAPATYSSQWVDTELGNVERAVRIREVQTRTSTGTIRPSNSFVLVDATAGVVTLTLPAASAADGADYDIVKVDASGNAVTIVGCASGNISLAARYNATRVRAGGGIWYRLS